jgi:hypothetical protein
MTHTRLSGFFLVIYVVGFHALCHPSRADQSLTGLEPMAILDGYSSSLRKQNIPLKDDEPIKSFLRRLDQLARNRSNLKTRFLSRDEIADGVRNILKPGSNDVTAGVGRFLRQQGFNSALTVDILKPLPNGIVLQLHTVSLDFIPELGKNKGTTEGFQEPITLFRGASGGEEEEKVQQVISKFFPKPPCVKAGLRMSLVSFHRFTQAPRATENQSWI